MPQYIRGHDSDDLADSLMVALECTEPLTIEFINQVLNDIRTFDCKQHDYGPENITAFGEKGVVVRMNDKMARLRNLVWGDKPASNEAIEDSYTDLSVYGVIARMCRAGAWPGVTMDRPGAPAEGTVETPWFDTDLPAMPAFGLQTIWTDHALRKRPEPMPPYDACSPLHKHEPDHWEDTPSKYWCPRCQCEQAVEDVVGGFACWNCHQFLFGPGPGSVRAC